MAKIESANLVYTVQQDAAVYCNIKQTPWL
jgi:hypothetical protein